VSRRDAENLVVSKEVFVTCTQPPMQERETAREIPSQSLTDK
jgi:hypothetical protein